MDGLLSGHADRIVAVGRIPVSAVRHDGHDGVQLSRWNDSGHSTGRHPFPWRRRQPYAQPAVLHRLPRCSASQDYRARVPAADHPGVASRFGAAWGYNRRSPPASWRSDHDTLSTSGGDGAPCPHRRCPVQLPYQCWPPTRPLGDSHHRIDSRVRQSGPRYPGPTACRPIPPSRRSPRTCVTFGNPRRWHLPMPCSLWAAVFALPPQSCFMSGAPAASAGGTAASRGRRCGPHPPPLCRTSVVPGPAAPCGEPSRTSHRSAAATP